MQTCSKTLGFSLAQAPSVLASGPSFFRKIINVAKIIDHSALHRVRVDRAKSLLVA